MESCGREAGYVSFVAGRYLLQVGEQVREVQHLAGGAQGRLQVHLGLRLVGHHGGQIGPHQLVLLRAQVHLFLVEEILGALQLAETEYKTRPTVYAADTLAWCYYKNGRIPEARKYSLKALSQNTPEAMFLYHRGMILAKAGDIGEARKVLYQALSQNPYFDPLGAVAAMNMVQEVGAISLSVKE